MVRILLVKLGATGDVLRTTTLLPGLTEKYQPAQIDWLTSKTAKEILLNNPFIRQICAWEERNILGKYDIVIGLEDGREACELVSSLKPAKIVGAYWDGNNQAYTPSTWFDMSAISRFGLEKANELKKLNRRTYQELMGELLGIMISPYGFKLTEEEIEYGGKAVGLRIRIKDENEGQIVGVNTGAGKRWPQKSWGIKPTIELIRRIKNELNADPLILGGEEERERNQIIARETGAPDAGVHSLRGFASIINQCSVVLSSDSLAMHFAIALKKKVVAFFGPTAAAEIELYGLGEKLTPPMDCLACYQKSCSFDPNCMDSLSVEAVFSAVKRQAASH